MIADSSLCSTTSQGCQHSPQPEFEQKQRPNSLQIGKSLHCLDFSTVVLIWIGRLHRKAALKPGMHDKEQDPGTDSAKSMQEPNGERKQGS